MGYAAFLLFGAFPASVPHLMDLAPHLTFNNTVILVTGLLTFALSSFALHRRRSDVHRLKAPVATNTSSPLA